MWRDSRTGPTEPPDDGVWTVHVTAEGRDTSRSFRVRPSIVRVALAALLVCVLVGSLVLGSWWFLAFRAVEANRLTSQVEELESDLARLDEVVRMLDEIEERYEGIRSLFGADGGQVGDAFLPPASGRSFSPSRPAGLDRGDELPTSWPLSERGFLTQPLIEEGGTGEDHPGIDIAVPAGSYFRAAGTGTVIEVGDDPVYGLYVMLDHGAGYRSLYAHASQIAVDRGALVRRNQVLGLTGSTGRSTAPHLHFEITRDGETIDPLEIVERP